ncbi:MAG: SusD/RagB family nutrient-binding outer membrane lipoprotein, partial [Tannerellaceae bacterium]|nr:SusD/RagB family nutrient-binding outer membrane lipoprotein [Tannerellaceae bacterium]
MKAYHKIIMGLASAALLTACSDFEDINKDPGAVDKDKVKVSYLLNKSIIGAQQNPHIAERLFVYQWKSAARFERRAGLAVGANYDEYNSDYLGTSFGVGWLNNVNMAINIGTERQDEEGTAAYENNVLQMARIWRAYLISELADCFGPIPALNSFDGVVKYQSVEELYDFMLEELKDAVEKIDVEADMSNIAYEGIDAFYNGNVSKWIKYANSLRLRYAMRLSEVDRERAQQAFQEAAATNNFITTLADMATVQEKDGYSELTGVMSRGWNAQPISATLNNMMIGLGGIEFQVPEAISTEVTLKDARKYMGMRLDQHLTTATNDPAAGYFFDALPATIDPRATVLFHIPGYDDGVHYFSN